MRVEILQSSPNFIQLVLYNSSQQFSSLIRRYLTKKVKTVQILGLPNSPLNTFDTFEHNLDYSTDFIQSQIQKIALNFSPKQIQDFKQEDYVFQIDAFNDTVHNLMITTQDIQIFDKNNQRYPLSFIRQVFPKNPDFIYLFILQPQQTLKFTAHATLSTSPTDAAFNHLSKLSVTPCVDNDIAQKRLNQKLANTPDYDKKRVTTDFNTTERFRCFHTDQFNQPFNYDISFYTISSLPPQFALYQVSSQAITDVQDLSNRLDISHVDSDLDLFHFPIHQEISIGQLLQFVMSHDLHRVFDKNDVSRSSSFPTSSQQTSSKPTNSPVQNTISNPSKQFLIEFVSFDNNQQLFFVRYNQKSHLSLDFVSSQIKFYLSRILILLHQFQTHFNSFS